MPRKHMIWNAKSIEGVPEKIVLDMTRFIEEGKIHECEWFVRQMLQCNFKKLALQAPFEERVHIGSTYRALLCDAPDGCFGSEAATLQWRGLRNLD